MSLAVIWVTAPGLAQPTTPAEGEQPTEDARARAGEHFERGIQFFNEGRFDAALAEFQAAYQLAPAHQVLYNLARVQAALGHAVESAQAYQQYLAEAQGEISGARRREAERALEQQRSRIGRLLVRTDLEGATIAVDGADVATTPLSEPLALSAGAHLVEVRAPAHEPVRRAVNIAGQQEQTLEVHLRQGAELRGNLRVTASVPEVAISVDGEEVGLTPLEATIPLRVGEHVVTAARAGYRTQRRELTVEGGAEMELSFDMHRSPHPAPDEIGVLRLRLPDAPYIIRVDGEPMLGIELSLPIGAHRIDVEVTDRQPYEGDVRIAPQTAETVTPGLSWTLEARNRRLQGANSQWTAGVVLTGVGAAIGLGSLGVLVWNETEIGRTNGDINQYNMQRMTCDQDGNIDPYCGTLDAQQTRLKHAKDRQDVVRAVTVAGVIVGAAAAALGLGFWLTAPDEDAVDAAAQARVRLRLSPTGVAVDGAF